MQNEELEWTYYNVAYVQGRGERGAIGQTVSAVGGQRGANSNDEAERRGRTIGMRRGVETRRMEETDKRK